MIINKIQEYFLQKKMVENKIDRSDVIKFMTTYALQTKVSVEESHMIAELSKKLLDEFDKPNK